MIIKTEILGLRVNPDRVWKINPKQSKRRNAGYSAPFPIWWKKFDLKGIGYTIGENQTQGDFIRDKLKKEFPKVISVESVDLTNADINMDITEKNFPKQVNFIFCMAVLEHVIDPPSAIRNMSKALTKDGLLFISVPGQNFKQHKAPIDCYRFLPDAMYAFSVIGKLKFVDYIKSGLEWCLVYRKEY